MIDAVGQCAKVLLQHDAYHVDQLEASNRLAELFTQATGFTYHPMRSSPDGEETKLDSGKALSPYEAALCLKEYRRTGVFLRGIHAALKTLLATHEQRPIRVLYAGSGPFAALLTPLLPLFRPCDVQIILLDIHERSLQLAQKLLESLGLLDRVAAFCRGDAVTYEFDSSEPLHMVVTETMQAALAVEPQVAVSAHLTPLLSPGGILIPQRIQLVAAFMDPRVEFSVERMQGGPSSRRPLGVAFELDQDMARRIDAQHGPTFPEGLRIAGGQILVPPRGPQEEMWILTEITVFESAVLRPYESSLTIPKGAPVEGPVREGQLLQFSYQMGQVPGLRCDVVDA